MPENNAETSCYVYVDDDGIDIDSAGESIEHVKQNMIKETMGWRYEYPDKYSHDEEWQRLLKYGSVKKAKITVD